MPSKDLACEFCSKTCRKNELAIHVKAKHKEELSKFILQEYIDEPNSNSLKRYASAINPKNNPIWSKLYDGCCYYFGANPSFFDEDDSYSSYIKSDENMKIHNTFLTELISLIPLTEFFKAERDIVIKSPEYSALQLTKWSQDKQIQELKEELDSLRKTKEYQQQVINDFKEATECSDNIDIMKRDISSLNCSVNYYRKEAEYYQQKLKEVTDSMDAKIDETIENSLSKIRNSENQLDEQLSINNKLKIELENLTTKRESYVNTRLEKEIKKVKDKLEKSKEKELDELQDEIDELKKKLRKTKRSSKSKADSDSDSD